MSWLAKIFIIAVNLAIFVALVTWLRNNISFGAVLVYLAAVPLGMCLAALALNIVLLLTYGWRLARLLERQILPSLATVILGFGLNGILPFRLGELGKIVYANRLFAIPPVSLAAATAVEKLLDLGVLALLGLWTTQYAKFEFVSGVVDKLLLLLLTGATVLTAGLWGLSRWRHASGCRAPWLFAAVDLLARKGNSRTLIAIVLWTAIIWLITVAMIFVTFVGMFAGFGFSDAVVLSLIIALAIALPSAPAGLGVVEAGIVSYLHQVLGADSNQALAAAFAFHFVTSFPQVLAAVAIIGWNLDLTVRLRTRFRKMAAPHRIGPT